MTTCRPNFTKTMMAFSGVSIGVWCVLAVGSSVVWGFDDWPQWRGANRDDISTETGLLEQWPEGGPDLVWHVSNGGDGYSGFSVVANRLYTMGADDDSEFALCLDASTGEEIWRQSFDKRYENGWGDGPRGTPAVSGDRVLVLSASGTVACLSTDDGSVRWTQSLTEMGGAIPGWGYSESVLIDGDQVVCTPGGGDGAIVALDINSGEVNWRSILFTQPAHYSSIIIADHPDKRHYVQLTEKAFAGIDPDDGSVLWQMPWRGRTAVIPTPIYHDKKVYITSGYGVGSTMVDISDVANPAEVWMNKVMKNHHGGVVLVDGHLYGYSDGPGWVCQNLETGESIWNEKQQLGKGAIGYADGRFYLVAEQSGEVALIDATTDGWRERGRFTLEPQSSGRKPRGKIWVHPVISDGRLFLRDQEMIWCFDVKSP